MKDTIVIISAAILIFSASVVPVVLPSHSLFQFPHFPEIEEWYPGADPKEWNESDHPIRSLYLRFSGVPGAPNEPSFVYIMVNNKSRMGGLWGVVGNKRTIDCWQYSENMVSSNHWICQSWTPWGLRQSDFIVQNNTLLLTTTYKLNQTMPVLDWYWEQCNWRGVDPKARIVFGLSDGSCMEMKWQIRTVPYVRWIWMKYTEWMTGNLRTVFFSLSQGCTVLLKENHGNDIAPLMSISSGTFQTLVKFDVRCPI